MAKIIRYALLMVCLFSISREMVVVAGDQSPEQQEISAEKKVPENKKQCRNLICLFDVSETESLFEENNFVGNELVNALREQVAPIIVTTDTLRHVCFWKAYPGEVLKNVRFANLGFYADSIIMAPLNDKDWHCYAHKQAELMLLIPKRYVTTHVSDQVNDISAQMEQCGFDVSNLDKISNVSSSTVLNYIAGHKRTYDTIIDYFESMFIKKSSDQVNDVSLWNIYVAGHGGIAFIDRRLTAETIAQRERELERLIAAEGGTGREIEEYKKDLLHWQQKARDFKKYGVIRGGWSAGLPFNDFLQLLAFCENGIRTSYLHYVTCCSGGSNQVLVNEELSRINVNYIISAHGINESRMPRERGIFGLTMFTNFFNAVERFFCNSTELVDPQKGIGKDSIRAIVSTVADKQLIDWTQPFVRMPGAGIFKAFSVDEQVKILTKSIACAHELEGSAIDFTDSGIKTIFVYPTYVRAPLKIKEHVAIVSPAPQTRAQSRESIHIFEKIIYNDELFSVIANFVSFNTRYEPIIFVIKELHCLDYSKSGLGIGDKKPIVIKDMIIHIKGSGNGFNNSLDVVTNVIFSFNGAGYSFSEEVKQLEKKIYELFNKFENASATPVTLLMLNALAEIIVGNTGMKELEKKEITVPCIIEYLENKVGKPVCVKKLGASKNVLLLKKLDTLERSVTQEALSKQKESLKTDHKPATALLSKLNSYKHDAEELKNAIDALPQEKLSVQARNDLQARITDAQTIINKEYDLAVSQLSWFAYAAMKMPSPVEVIKKAGAGVMHKAQQLFIKEDYKGSKKR